MSDGFAPPARPIAHGFGQPAQIQGERWPLPVAGAAILGLSLLGWAAVFVAGRVLLSLFG